MRMSTSEAARELGVSVSLLLRHADAWGITLIPKNPKSLRKTYIIEQSDVDEYKRQQTKQSEPVRQFEI